MYREQYTIKNCYKPTMASSSSSNSVKNLVKIDLSEKITIDEKGEPISDCLISFFNPAHLSALLCNYSALKEEVWGKFSSDIYYLMEDLDILIEKTLKNDYPLYYKLLIYKIDGRQNLQIQELLNDEFLAEIKYLSSNVLNPLLNVSNEGKLIPRFKIRGKKKVIQQTFEQMKALAQDRENYSEKCFITNADCYEDAKALADLIEAYFPKMKGKVVINSIGTTIGSHTGPGTVALFFWGDERVD